MVKVTAISLSRISVRGVVQGVGFRPFVYQLAIRHNLHGWVCNTSEDVKIEAEGNKQDIEFFINDLREQAPPMSYIEEIEVTAGRPEDYAKFEIRPSVPEAGKYQLISPDIATCPDCLREIFSPSDRRYRYPFTNCTNCGPRFTIINDIPYDRPNTTMKSFQMCPECQKEYNNPFDRRFHAQPNACPVCGPQLELRIAQGVRVDTDDIIKKVGELLKNGKIIAIKGLGGFLLACDATSDKAVNLLRLRKNRPAKPLAIMVATIEEAERHCEVDEDEAKLLTSPGSPIVLMKWKTESNIFQSVAPGLKYLGVMLPYTPLHHLLLKEAGLPLVMTSGNLSEEPIARDNDEALKRLSGIADYFLMHNRDIYARYDDSVMIVEQGIPRFTRRARGYAPYPIRLPFKSRQILGCGAEEKNTFCLTRDNYAFVSQHIGDMENLETLEHYVNTITLYKKLFRIEPQIIACDMHPEYLPTKYAKELAEQEKIKLVSVQHHHAHIASCLADNGVKGPVIGVSFDGTGYGTDGNIWGGEFMVADFKKFDRPAYLEYLPLAGGAQAIRKPYRTAIGYLLALGIGLDKNLPLFKYIKKSELEIIKEQVAKGVNAPLTSSMGRLFDAVTALTGIRGIIEYEAQAAIDLEMLAYIAADENGSYPFALEQHDSTSVIRLHDLFTAIIKDVLNKTSEAVIAARFHNTVVHMILETCQDISAKTSIIKVALSGGVFQNRLLVRKTLPLLESAGFEVYTHRQVPCNDGGISLGQVVIANTNEV
ncbi:MAG: carbamoyltransferase HypF [Chloroflexi bacterium RBG_13_51_52]|nr:MAG: carbamoyltransferase HypF [Chloroflexi bacterium RBG_13_51_52]